VLKELLLPIVNVLLQTLNSMNNHGINIVIVKLGSVINTIPIQIVVNYLLNALTTVNIVLMIIAVMRVIMATLLILLVNVNGKNLLVLNAWKVVILVKFQIDVINVLLDIWKLTINNVYQILCFVLKVNYSI
jgi:hypothetical protein